MLTLGLLLMGEPLGTNFTNILIGIIASSIVLLISSLVAYAGEKKECIDSLIAALNNLSDELGTIRTNNTDLDVSYNISLIEKCHIRLLAKIKSDCSEMTFLFSNKLRKYICSLILNPLDMAFFDISTHYSMLRWILLYKECDEMICAHYLECLRIDNLSDKKEIHYLPIENYIELTNEERVAYHNNEIISRFIYPILIDSVRGTTVVHVLSSIFSEVTSLYYLPNKIFLSEKYIEKIRISDNEIARHWNTVSDEIHGALKDEIKEIRASKAQN